MVRNYKVLNGWKGVFALLIMMLHFEGIFIGVQKYFETCYLCVEGFAVISGFLFALSLKKLEEPLNPFLFTWRRMKNLYPLYLYAISIIILLFILFPAAMQTRISINPSSLVGEILMMQNSGIFSFNLVNGADWYISAWLISTLLICIFVKIFKKNNFILATPIVVILIYSFLITKAGNLDIHGQMYGIVTGGVLRVFAAMCIGILSFYFAEHLQNRSINGEFVNYIEIVATIWLMSILIAKHHSSGDVLILIPLAALVFCATKECGMISLILKTKIFQWLGDFSLVFYLTHFFTIYLMLIIMPSISRNRILSTVSFFVIEFLVAIFSKWFVDNFLSKIQTRCKSWILKTEEIKL